MHTSQKDLVARSMLVEQHLDVPAPRRRIQHESERSLAMMVVQAHAGQPDSSVSLYVLAARTIVAGQRLI